MLNFFLALLSGVVLPVQAGINAGLRTHLGHPVWAALASFCTGAVVLAAFAALLRLPFPQLAGAPLWSWSGGILGTLYVTMAVFLTPKIGSANFIGLAIAGQLLGALVLDHMGWLGVPQHSLNLSRVFGALLLMAGVYLLSQK